MKKVLWIAALLFGMSAGPAAFGDVKPFQPDSTKISDGKVWKLVNSEATVTDEAGKQVVHLKTKGVSDAGNEMALALVEGAEFSEGTIEIDLKGQNKKQKSFLGVAFGALDEKNFEAVYFRPFNFRAEDQVAHSHAVQYIMPPNFPWERLRKEHQGVYEAAVNPVPDPDEWFHARIEVTARKVRAFVNDAKEPSLVVDRLREGAKGRVGLWVGVYDGAFANLKLTPAK